MVWLTNTLTTIGAIVAMEYFKYITLGFVVALVVLGIVFGIWTMIYWHKRSELRELLKKNKQLVPEQKIKYRELD